MLDKFENATLLLRIRLPSTLIRIKRSTKTELFENALQSGTIWERYFFVLVWTETFLYPQLFEYANVILSCNLSSQVEWQERISETSNCEILKVNNHLKCSSEDAEHLFRFHVWTQNISSIFALKVAFSNLSGIVWTRPEWAEQRRKPKLCRTCFTTVTKCIYGNNKPML